MFRTSGKTVGLVAAAALSLALMGSAATAQLTVDIRDRAELERKEVPVNSKKKIALTAQASGGSGLTFQWELLGVGSLSDVTKSAIFYYPPTTIDSDTEQAIITLRVKDADGNEAQSGVTLTIVGGGNDDPTPTPESTVTPTPASCSKDKSASNNPNCDTCGWWSRMATYTREWEKSGKRIGRAAEPCECVEEIGTDGSRVMYRINEDGSATFLPKGSILSGVFVDARVPSENWGTGDGRHLNQIRRGTSCSEPSSNQTTCPTCGWWSRIATHIGRAANPSECVEEIGKDGSRVMYRVNEDGSATFLPKGSILSGEFVNAEVSPEHWKTGDGRSLVRIRRGTSCSEP